MNKWFLYALFLSHTLIAYAFTPMDTDTAFKLTAKAQNPNSLMLRWAIKPGFFLYRDRIHIKLVPSSSGHIGPITLPKAQQKTTAEGTIYQVYYQNLTILVPVLHTHAGRYVYEVSYQGCAKNGFCYPPQTKYFDLKVDKTLDITQISKVKAPADKTIVSEPNTVNSTPNRSFFNHQPLLITFLSFFGMGLLLAFTPCVLPMVPVLSGMIVGQTHLSTRQAFWLSLSYVMSMACMYAVIGAVVAKAGHNLQIIMQSPWVIGLFSLLFVVLALSMFGLFELRLPASLQNKLSYLARTKNRPAFMQAIIMGALSILILSPCVTPPLIGALSYIAQDGQITTGMGSLFFLGLGLGFPLLIIGTSLGHLLPKAGHWMSHIKAFFGVLLLIVAIQLAARVMPYGLTMWLWSSLFIMLSVFLGAFQKAVHPFTKIRQGVGLICALQGTLILVGNALGTHDVWHPLQLNQPVNSIPSVTTITSLKALKAQLAALPNNKPVLLDFYADWCTSCHFIEKQVLASPAVVKALQCYKVLKIDITAYSKESRELMQAYEIIAPPTFVFLSSNHVRQPNKRLVGDITQATLLRQLNT